MEPSASTMEWPPESVAEPHGEPLEHYLLDRPALMLTVIDMAERYAGEGSPDGGTPAPFRATIAGV